MKNFERAIQVVKEGGIVAFKTDTVMGVGANGFDKDAVEKLFLLKKRDFKKPVALLLPTLSSIFEYAVVSEMSLKLMEKYFPGAFTCILPAKKCVYTTPLSCGDTIGIRIPDLFPLREFLAELNLPLVTTSANVSGLPPLKDKKGILETFNDNVYYVEIPAEMSGVPSTVVDCSKGSIKVIREGGIKI